MGIWRVNDDAFHVNIKQSAVNNMQSKGWRFCWMKHNPSIMDQNDDTYYETVKQTVGGEEKNHKSI